MKLHSSNDPLPDATRASIASHREALREASTALKDLMSATKSILTRIEETDAVVNTALDDMSAILHPIRSFPDDILSIIFHLCVPSTDINVIDTTRGVINHIIDSLCTSSPPWSLSYVCRGWRALVLSSPTLWSTLCIPLDVHAHAPHPQVSFRLGLYLQRSENRELDVYLQEIELFDKFREDGRVADSYGALKECGPENFFRRQDFFILLQPTTLRWRQLKMDINDTYFDDLCSSSFKCLRELDFFSCDDRQTQGSLPFKDHLDMHGVVELNMRSAGPLGIALDNVRILTSSFDTLDDLPKMVNLEILHLHNTLGGIYPYNHVHGIDMCVLPNLHTISFSEGTGILDIDELLDLQTGVTAPILRTLELKFKEDMRYNPSDYPQTEQLHNLSNLSIDITWFWKSDAIILALLSLAPSLAALYLGPENAIPVVLEGMSTHLVPKLTSLRMHLSTMREHAESVISLVESRQSSNDVATLKELWFVRSGRDEWYTVATILEEVQEQALRQRWDILQKTTDIRYLEIHVF